MKPPAKPVLINQKKLPAFCPNPAMEFWSAHPKVFLDFNENGMASCPYCGTQYMICFETKE